MGSLGELISRREEAISERDKMQRRINYYRALYKKVSEYGSTVESRFKVLAKMCMDSIKEGYSGKYFDDYHNYFKSIDAYCAGLSSNFSHHSSAIGKRIRDLENRKEELNWDIDDLQYQIDNWEEDDENE